MRRMKNNTISSRSNSMIEARFREMDASVYRSMACSGITHLTPAPPMQQPEAEPLPPGKKTVPKKAPKPRPIAKNRAADIAVMAIEKNMGIDDIKAQIPKYAHPLPRRQWIRKFFDALPIEAHEKYADLKKLYAQ